MGNAQTAIQPPQTVFLRRGFPKELLSELIITMSIVNSVVLVLYGAYQLQLVTWDGILDMMSFSEIVWKAETRWSNLVGWVDG